MIRTAILILVLSLAAGDAPAFDARKSTWQKLSDGAELPPELLEAVDVIEFARFSSMRNPLSFSPYRVTGYRSGWRRGRESGYGVGVDEGKTIGQKWATAKQKFSFSLDVGDSTRWDARCGVVSSSESIGYEGRSSSLDIDLRDSSMVECEMVERGTNRRANLRLESGAASSPRTHGLGRESHAAGLLSTDTSEYRIQPLLVVRGSRIIGDIPGGFLYVVDDLAVGAVQSRGPGAPFRFTVARSLPDDEKALLAAATAALTLHERAVAD